MKIHHDKKAGAVNNEKLQKQKDKQEVLKKEGTPAGIKLGLKNSNLITTLQSKYLSVPGIRNDKVSRIKSMISKGQYRIDSSLIAGKIMEAYGGLFA